MAKYKNFNDLKENDYIFSAEIKDSRIEQNCVGNIYAKYIITKIEKDDDEQFMVLSVVQDKSSFLKNWKKENCKEQILIDVNKNTTYRIIDNTKDIKYLNYTIFSTNVETIACELNNIIKKFKEKVNEAKKTYEQLRTNLTNMEMSFEIRAKMIGGLIEINAKPEYQETVVTESVIV